MRDRARREPGRHHGEPAPFAAATAVVQIQGSIAVGNEYLVTPVLESVSGTNSWAGAIQAANGGSLTLQSDAGTLTVSGTVNAQSADTTNQALILSGAGNGVIGSPITNAASVTKSGGGTWQFAATNSYSATTNVNQGVLQAGAANAFSPNSNVVMADANLTALDLNGFNQTIKSLSGGGATGGYVLLGSGNLTMGSTGDTTHSAVITGTGSVIKQGSGAFTVGSTGAVNASGGIQVNAGAFYVNGSTSAATAVSVAANATLGGTGAVTGTATVGNNGTLEAGQNGEGSLTVGNVIFGSGAGDVATINLADIDQGASASAPLRHEHHCERRRAHHHHLRQQQRSAVKWDLRPHSLHGNAQRFLGVQDHCRLDQRPERPAGRYPGEWNERHSTERDRRLSALDYGL